MSDERTFEMLWDCPACGTQKLLARSQRHCPNCGSPQDPAWRYFPAEDEATEVKNYTYVGADVICPNCETPNSKAANFCVNCAAPLKEGVTVKTLGTQTRGEGESFAQEDLKARRRAEKEAARGVSSRASGVPARGKGVPAWVWVLGLFAVLAVAVWAFSLTRDELVTVSGHTWQREIKVQEFRPVSGSAWCDSLPVGAYNVSSFSAIRSYREIPDGQTCRTVRRDNGDGTYSQRRECETKYRSEPIYDRKCNYVVNAWVYSRSATTRGESQQPAPFWAVQPLERPGSCLGCEREAGRSERYDILLRRPDPKNPDFRCKIPLDVWSRISVGQVVDMKVGYIAGDARCDTLKFRP
jgi:hypothetical protein